MSKHHKLTLTAAIFTNINIMAGAGIFINTVLLTKLTGIIGSFAYLMIGLFMLPLITSIAYLVKQHPTGGFYAFAQPISPFLGFLSCWIYFFSKLASTSLVLYVSAVFLKQLFPNGLSLITTLPLSLCILTLFTYLNLFNIHIGSVIQKVFFSAKSIPVLFVISIGLMHCSTFSLSFNSINFSSVSTTIPLVLYCLAGFEAACAISRNIENPQENAPKAIFYSFFILVAAYTIFQLFTSMMILPNINHLDSYQDAFPYITQFIPVPWLSEKISSFLSLCILTSTLGGAYGMLFSNQWNLYTLAEHNHTFASRQITTLNNHEIPTLAVLIEAFVCGLYLLITQGNQIPLQQTASLGAAIAYTISIIALLLQTSRLHKTPWLALVTCSGFIVSCIISTLTHSISSLTLFIIMLTIGIVMFHLNKKQNP